MDDLTRAHRWNSSSTLNWVCVPGRGGHAQAPFTPPPCSSQKPPNAQKSAKPSLQLQCPQAHPPHSGPVSHRGSWPPFNSIQKPLLLSQRIATPYNHNCVLHYSPSDNKAGDNDWPMTEAETDTWFAGRQEGCVQSRALWLPLTDYEMLLRHGNWALWPRHTYALLPELRWNTCLFSAS